MGLLTDLLAHLATGQVVGGGVDAAPDAREGALVRGVVVGGPLQAHVDARALLEHEELVLRAEVLPEPIGEVGGARQAVHHHRGGAAVGAVPGDVAGEGGGDEGGALIGPPLLGEDPADARLVDQRVHDVVGAPPRQHGDLALFTGEVLVALAGGRGRGGDDLDVAGVEVDAVRVVAGLLRVGALPEAREVAQGADRARVVVPALHAPGGDRGVLHGAPHGEVGLHAPLEVVEHGARPAQLLHEGGVVRDVVEDDEPVARRGLGFGAVGPELREHAGVITAGHHLRRVGLAGHRVGGIARAPVAPLEVVVVLIGLGRRRERSVAHPRGGDIHHHAVRGVEVRGPDAHHLEPVPVAVEGVLDERGSAGVLEDPVVEAVALVHRLVLLAQRPAGDDAPLGRDEVGVPERDHVARLIDEELQAQGLPAVGIGERRVARELHHEGVIDGQVEPVGEVVGLVAVVSVPVGEHRRRDPVTDGAGGVAHRRVVGGVEALGGHHRVVLGEHHGRPG